MAENATILYFAPTERQGRLVEVSICTPPEDIDPDWWRYGELLLAKKEDFPYKFGDFDTLQPKRDGITPKRCIEIGRMALVELESITGEPTALTTTMLSRICIMGLGISKTRYFGAGMFAGMGEFLRAIGSSEGVSRNSFDDWTGTQFRDAASEVETIVGGKPTRQDYEAYAAAHPDFPGIKIINRMCDGVGGLNEMLGYPDVKRWSEKVYVDFGVNFVVVNGHDKFTSQIIDMVAGKKRGPSRKAIRDKFESFDKFKQIVLENVAARQADLAGYRDQIRSDDLPHTWVSLSESEVLMRGSRMQLLHKFAPQLHMQDKIDITVFTRFNSFTFLLLQLARENDLSYSSENDINSEVRKMGLYEYILPDKPCYMDHIYVTDDEVAMLREENSRLEREKLERKKAAERSMSVRRTWPELFGDRDVAPERNIV